MRGLDARSQDFVLMIWPLDAIDGATDEIDEAARAIEFAFPMGEGSGVPCDVPPWTGGFRGISRKYVIGMPRAERCLAREVPRKPEPPAMTTFCGVWLVSTTVFLTVPEVMFSVRQEN
jgi:hypothetical protein